MNVNKIYSALNELDDDLIVRSEEYSSNHHSYSIFHRFSTVIIAAILTCIMVSAGIATVKYSDSIQHWFSHYWEIVTGHKMSDAHSDLIDHLSQDIGISKSVGKVTVTVDSATVGEDSFFMLLKVSGADFKKRYHYNFDKIFIDISPDPWVESPGVGSFGGQYKGMSENNDAIILFEYDFAASDKNTNIPWSISLSLDELVEYKSNKNEIIACGPWEFDFTITPNMLDDIIALPDTEITAFKNTSNEYTEVPLIISNIEVNNTSVRFSYAHNNGTLTAKNRICAILSDGQEIGISGGSGIVEDDMISEVYRWIIPIELTELSAVKIGDTIIPVQ